MGKRNIHLPTSKLPTSCISRIDSSWRLRKLCSHSSIQTSLKLSTTRDTPSSASTSPQTLSSTGSEDTSSVTSTRASRSPSCPPPTPRGCSPGSPSFPLKDPVQLKEKDTLKLHFWR